jgi:ABC-type branched-subunit amino acid transport system substrate-binding protein
LAAQGFDSANLVLKAFKNVESGKLFGSEVAALENVGETVSVTGTIEPDKDGDFIRKLRLVQVKDKNLVELR